MTDTLIIKNAFSSPKVDETLDIFLPEFISTTDKNRMIKCATAIAEAFDIERHFLNVLKDSSTALEHDFVEKWNSNVHLLIDKTWVESADEFFKMETSRMLDKITTQLANAILNEDSPYLTYFESFSNLLRDITYLLFGKEAKQDSVVEYVLRMEPHFGLFCYYLLMLKEIKNIDEDKARLAMLIALIFLAEF